MKNKRFKQGLAHTRVAPRLTAVAKNRGIKNKGKSVSLQTIFKKLTTILKNHGKGLRIEKKILGSLSKKKKVQLHLYGMKLVPGVGSRNHPVHIAGVIIQKSFVGFYCMPLYSHSKEIILPKVLGDLQSGKSCLHIISDDASILEALDKLLKKSISLYRKENWI